MNTVKTRMRCLYDKLGAHRRPEAIEQVGALGLLALPQLLGTTPATAARRYRNKP